MGRFTGSLIKRNKKGKRKRKGIPTAKHRVSVYINTFQQPSKRECLNQDGNAMWVWGFHRIASTEYFKSFLLRRRTVGKRRSSSKCFFSGRVDRWCPSRRGSETPPWRYKFRGGSSGRRSAGRLAGGAPPRGSACSGTKYEGWSATLCM